MDNIGRQKRIEQFLSKELTDSERKAFLLEMENDPELAEEVALIELMHDELSNSSKQAFIRKLDSLSDEFFGPSAPSPPKNGRGSVLKFGLGTLLILILGFLTWQVITPPERASPLQEQTTDPPTNFAPEEAPPTEAQPNNSDQEEEQVETQPPSPSSNQRPVAEADPADFLPNPYLDDLVQGQVRSEDIHMEVKPDLSPDGHLIVEGIIKIAGTAPPEEYLLFIYSNKGDDYLNGDYLIRLPLELKPMETTENERNASGQVLHSFTFAKEFQVDWEPGWYYYFIALARDEEPLFVGKIVKQ